VKIAYAVESHMVLELDGSTYIACWMNLVHGEAAKKFLQIMCVSIGDAQNKTNFNEVMICINLQ
jgi:hypothetical protein